MLMKENYFFRNIHKQLILLYFFIYTDFDVVSWHDVRETRCKCTLKYSNHVVLCRIVLTVIIVKYYVGVGSITRNTTKKFKD